LASWSLVWAIAPQDAKITRLAASAIRFINSLLPMLLLHTCSGVTDATISLNAGDVNKKPCRPAAAATDLSSTGSCARDRDEAGIWH
jgi:hypothetical protein